ncbi:MULTISPECIES: NAD-dependent succinate-semialdehyde dehydrogenase [unclassified Sphingomonas]|uniref:NAD-dependent succinate-semialdehyde dehydrogenase n=1 Tax=unclassified Sphingomonas TaxID=196159 RepID=UPI000929A816|nr:MULTISPECIES: NAD-dependent succinate-semialdehyde dehydrogenase [unclassified Sphingomonas]MBN8847011.1 NAD-dependent succinate-semialdehyde dehydrogenase [Sphingomonas sp.]OJV33114.1 MAG: succinate-semialdehyde dehydrogenase (NADP(+)) [Sphingomonas sp. 67-36]
MNDPAARPPLARPDLLREAGYIGGEWVTASAALDVTNPATGAVIGTVPMMGAVEAEQAVTAAAAAFPLWKAKSAKERATVLKRWHALMEQHGDDLAKLMTAEQGKPLAEARGEVSYAAAFLEWFAEEARRINGLTIPGHAADKRLVVVQEPVGVVAAITPWNFPAAMITRKVGPALAAGCTVVLKPSELTPYSALALAVLAEEAGVPAGVLNIVTGDAVAIGEVVTTDQRVRKFTFTGSTPVGKLLAAKCAGTVKRVSLELGGNAPFIVFDDADLDKAVAGAIASKFRNTGQTCVCANRLYVQAGVYDAFAERLAAAVGTLAVGDGLADETQQGPLIDERARAKVAKHIEDALARGAHLLRGGHAIPGPGTFFEPTVLTDVPADALLCREETFGPVAGLVRFDTEAEVIALANDTAAGLAAYLFTRDLSRTWRVGEGLQYGMVGVNTGLISTEVAPFGGVKESGIGREGSVYGIRDYIDAKTLCIEVEPA